MGGMEAAGFSAKLGESEANERGGGFRFSKKNEEKRMGAEEGVVSWKQREEQFGEERREWRVVVPAGRAKGRRSLPGEQAAGTFHPLSRGQENRLPMPFPPSRGKGEQTGKEQARGRRRLTSRRRLKYRRKRRDRRSRGGMLSLLVKRQTIMRLYRFYRKILRMSNF